jgi:hypothetical protein
VTPLAIESEIEHHGLSVSRWIGRALFAADPDVHNVSDHG